MISNSKEHITDDADFIIVGSGCAGSTVARWLSAAGKSVILIEEGAPPQISRNDSSIEAMAKMYRDAGTTVAMGSDTLPLLQGKCLGGGSVINAGIQIRFPEWVWQEWVNSDAKWKKLLPWKELMDANDILDKELQIEETPKHLLGGNGEAMLRAFGDKAHPIRRNTPGCEGSGRCIVGCPTGGKESTDKNYINTAIKNGTRVYTHCAVKKVVIKNKRAIGIEGKFKSGASFKAHAKKAVILAASAVNTPWILLKSGIKLNGNGFMCHPGSSVMGLFDEKIMHGPGGTQTAEVLHYCKENIKFETMILPPDLKAARVPGFGDMLVSRLERVEYTANWQVACKAEARGKIIRGPFGPMVFYTTTEKDKKNILRGISMMAEGMLNIGAKEIWPSVYGVPEIITTVEEAKAIADIKPVAGIMPMAATHLFCGVDVGDKFQVEGIEGLVVADSSLFPSNIGVNPMTSIMSVAKLVADSWT